MKKADYRVGFLGDLLKRISRIPIVAVSSGVFVTVIYVSISGLAFERHNYFEVFLSPRSTMYPSENVWSLVIQQAVSTVMVIGSGWLFFLLINRFFLFGFAREIGRIRSRKKQWYNSGYSLALAVAFLGSLPAFIWAYAIDGVGFGRESFMLSGVAAVLGSGAIARVSGVQIRAMRALSATPATEMLTVSAPPQRRNQSIPKFLVRGTRMHRFFELGAIAPGLVGATLVVEITLSIRGLSRLVLDALTRNDVAVLVWATIALVILSETIELFRWVFAMRQGFHRA